MVQAVLLIPLQLNFFFKYDFFLWSRHEGAMLQVVENVLEYEHQTQNVKDVLNYILIS